MHNAYSSCSIRGSWKTATELVKLGADTLPLHWDLADLGAIDGNIGAIESRFGGVDVLVSITDGPPPTPAAGQDPATWSQHFQSMVLSVIAVAPGRLPRR